MNQRFSLRRCRAVALALSACVFIVAAPTAGAVTQDDLRSPDARAAAQEAAEAAGYTDLRSPDARDAAQASEHQAQSGTAARDLRSPDARDAANGITTRAQPTPATAPVETRTVITVEERGSQTLSIVLSAGALFIALLAMAFVGIARRPRPRWSAP